MPDHSDAHRQRTDNPYGRYKEESEHIEHVQQRLVERFGIHISVTEYYEFLRYIQTNHSFLYAISHNDKLFEITYRGKLIWVIYGSGSSGSRGSYNFTLPARIKTVLLPYTQYVVPLKLDHLFDQRSFTREVNATLDMLASVSKQVDVSNRKDFFVGTNYLRPIKYGALLIAQGTPVRSPMIVKLAVRTIWIESGLMDSYEQED